MKPSLKSLIVNTLAVCVMLLTALNVQAQEGKYDFPTDRAELPYNVLEMVELIQTAYEAPVESNAYVQMVANAEGLPALELGQTLVESTGEESHEMGRDQSSGDRAIVDR